MKTKSRKVNLNILKSLFWEYNWGSVKENLASSFVIARILELGTPEQFHLFAGIVGDKIIKTFLNKAGRKLLSPQSLNFWKLYYQKNETTK
jgi:hypothetical protein